MNARGRLFLKVGFRGQWDRMSFVAVAPDPNFYLRFYLHQQTSKYMLQHNYR